MTCLIGVTSHVVSLESLTRYILSALYNAAAVASRALSFGPSPNLPLLDGDHRLTSSAIQAVHVAATIAAGWTCSEVERSALTSVAVDHGGGSDQEGIVAECLLDACHLALARIMPLTSDKRACVSATVSVPGTWDWEGAEAILLDRGSTHAAAVCYSSTCNPRQIMSRAAPRIPSGSRWHVIPD